MVAVTVFGPSFSTTFPLDPSIHIQIFPHGYSVGIVSRGGQSISFVWLRYSVDSRPARHLETDKDSDNTESHILILKPGRSE
jgi:hypothetical protein